MERSEVQDPLEVEAARRAVPQGMTRLWPQITDAERAAVLRVLDSGVLSGANAPEGGKIARENGLKSCTRCHHPHIGKEEHVDLARKGLLMYP